jgi:predicted nucleic acid-binding protein
VAALLDQAELVGVSTIALGELRTGFLLGGNGDRRRAARAGKAVPTNDIWIVATAARNGATVLTCDDHFERIGRVGSIVID